MNKENRVAIYCRLSKDDEQCGDSVSIETQKMMLETYCISHNFEIYDIYVDDGYSGLNFNRPSFKRLIIDLENGNFDIVITKDLSRLGRDYIQTGYYIDVYFVSKNIRYIAVNDGIDTLQDNNDIAPFKNILNDMYAKDLSRKVKSAKQQRAKKGMYISAQPPYGYKVDPFNRNKLIVDSEPASIVKLIFELAISGKSYSEISRILERNKIITPSFYKVMNGDTRFLKATTEDRRYKWHYQTVRTIIRNPVYVGDMVNHKYEILNYKTKERVKVPVENQIIVQNTHEPIIDRNMFEEVNKKISNRRKPNHSYENIFKGLIFCDECGEQMQLIAGKSEEKAKPMFRCPKHAADKSLCTHNHYIYYDDLLNLVHEQLYSYIELFINSLMFEELCEKLFQQITHQAQEIKKGTLQKNLQIVNRRIKDRYKSISIGSENNDLESLNSIRMALMKQLSDNYTNSISLSTINSNDFKERIKTFLKNITIDQEVLKLFISKIEIGYLERGTQTGINQKIKINYHFSLVE